MNFAGCLKKGLIKRDASTPGNIGNSIASAERFLNSAKSNFGIRDYEMVELASYNSAFHSARALLFAKGYKERSHYCLAVALRHLYKENTELVELINSFDELRHSRHNVQYGGTLVNREEAEYVLGFASDFLELVKKSLKKTIR